MTTALKSPVIRETAIQYRKNPLIVEITSHLLIVREKGQRDRVEIPWDAIYELGMKLRAKELERRAGRHLNPRLTRQT
jgi:hypothetical protein